MKLEELKGKKILIVGYGVEGKSTEAYLKKHLPEAEIGIADKTGGEDYLASQTEYDLAVRSPSIHSNLITIPYTTTTNIFFANAKGKIIGVTGTKGKSTTSTLIYEILKTQGEDAYLGGNIGIPALDFIDELKDDSITVLELSSFHLTDIKYSPHIAVFLMTAPEHLDHHQDMGTYVDAKRNILRFQKTTDYAVLNSDYVASRESDLLTDGRVYWTGVENQMEQGCFVKDGGIYLRMHEREERIMEVKDVLLKGKHNLENVCAAIVASLLAGAEMKAIIKTLKTFKGLDFRLEYVAEKNGIRFYNDSLATIPEATVGALEALGDDVETLIAGGFDRGLEFDLLGKCLASSTVKNLILFPTTGEKIWESICIALPNEKLRPQKVDVDNMKDAVRIAAENTSSGKICLMSPASASFGTFKDYRDRGNQFKEEVNKL